MITIRTKLNVTRKAKGRKVLNAAPKSGKAGVRGVPRIARLVALAIKFDRLLGEGRVRDQSELARFCHVSQPRITQIMNLGLLSPRIIEELLFLAPVRVGRPAVHERMLRTLTAEPDWSKQSRMWNTERSRQVLSVGKK